MAGSSSCRIRGNFVGFGSAYTFSAFVEPLQREFGASRGSVSLVFSLAGFLYFGLGIVSGPLADRFGARRLAVAGMILTGLGLAAASAARNLLEVYAAYGLGVGLGVGCAYVPAIGAVQRWFVRRRGFASGLAVSGIGVGTLLMPPLASQLIELLGWRDAYLVLGGLATTMGAGAALLIENDPRDRGSGPRWSAATRRPAAAAGGHLGARSDPIAPLHWPLRQLFDLLVRSLCTVRSSRTLCSGPWCCALLGGIATGRDRRRQHSWALLPWRHRRPDGPPGFTAADVRRKALALVTWVISVDIWSLTAFALLYGVFYGGWVAVLPAVVMDYFGGRHVSSIIGVLYTSVGFGTLVGPSAAGFAFDLSHSYVLPIMASAGANIIAAVIVAVRPLPFRNA
jgi:MFS family permease